MGGDGQGVVDSAFLEQIPIFGGLPPHALARIAAALRVSRVEPGTRVISEGEHAATMLIVGEGELEVCKRGPAGEEFRLATLRRGDCVGEMSLIDIQPRSATVQALGPAVLYVLSHAEIAKLQGTDLEAYTLLVLNIAREISRRLRGADRLLASLGITDQSLWVAPPPRS